MARDRANVGGGQPGPGQGGQGGQGGDAPASTAALFKKIASDFLSIPTMLKSLIQPLVPFVQALNPGAVEAMNVAFENLQATIGYGLEPIIELTTEIFRAFSRELADVFTKLRPIVSELSSMFLNVLTPVIAAYASILRAVVEILQAWMPAIRFVIKILEAFAVTQAIFIQFVALLFTMLGEYLGQLLNSLLGLDEEVRKFDEVIVGVFVNLIKLTDAFLRLIGAVTLADRFLDLFGRQKTDEIKRAPKDIGITSTEELYRKRLEAAAKAAGGKPLETTESILGRIEKEIIGFRGEVNKMLGREGGAVAAGADLTQREPDRWANRQQGPEPGEDWIADWQRRLGLNP